MLAGGRRRMWIQAHDVRVLLDFRCCDLSQPETPLQGRLEAADGCMWWLKGACGFPGTHQPGSASKATLAWVDLGPSHTQTRCGRAAPGTSDEPWFITGTQLVSLLALGV